MTDISSVPFWCQKGKFIDAKDSMNDWCVGIVMDISYESRSITVTMDGWGDKCNTTYPFKTSKLAPFRKMTKPYTGPKSKAYRNWDISMQELEEMSQKLENALNGDLECENAYETTQFYRGKLMILVENLLVFDFKHNKEFLKPTVNFFSLVISLVVK